VEQSDFRIICTNFAEGKKHDLTLFKESRLEFQPTQKLLVDTGYTGILKIHENCGIPLKKGRNRPLTKEQKEHNKKISKLRVVIENVIGDLKKFKIISERYRNRRRRFGLRFNIFAAAYNFEL